MILLAVGLLLAATALVIWALLASAVGRWTGKRLCGGCAHELAPDQYKCPECGQDWTREDPGAATVFRDVADRVERVRRTALVQIWATILAAAPMIALGAAYLSGALPRSAPPNAMWSAPIQTAKRGEPWGGNDVDMLVTVEGWADDPAEVTPGAVFKRVHEARFTALTATQRTAPVDDVVKMQRLGAMVTMQPLDQAEQVAVKTYSASGRRTSAGSMPGAAFVGSFSGQFGAAMAPQVTNDFSLLTTAQRTRAIELMVRVTSGQRVDENIAWGNSGTSYTPMDMVVRRSSLQQQTVIGVALLGALAIFTSVLWIRVWRLNRLARQPAVPAPAPSPAAAPTPTTKPRSA